MLLNDKEANERLSSPNNLLNRLRSASGRQDNSKGKAMSLFGMGASPSSASQQVSRIVEQKKEEVVVSFKNPFSSIDYDPTPPSIPATIPEVKIDDLIDNADSKIKIETAHNEALDAMVKSVQQLKLHLSGMENPVKLADVASKMSKIVSSIRAERMKIASEESTRSVHLHLYSPEQKKIEQFEAIDV